MSTAAVNPFLALNPAATSSAQSQANEASDRFLKLLVTQMQNQDPLNPMDNAQVTSQMAQISTVSGIEKLNTTVGGLNGHLMQMQALQGASLVGRHVTLEGNRLSVSEGQAGGGFELASAADNVRVDILSSAGQTIQTLNLGAASAGRNGFIWETGDLPQDARYSFRVTATAGGSTMNPTHLMFDKVQSVSFDGGDLQLETQQSGTVAYRDVRAVN